MRVLVSKILVFGLMLVSSQAIGQSFSIIHNFTNSPDGNYPQGGLTLSGGTLYGTTSYGGSASNGIVFKVNTDGGGFAVLHNFSAFGLFSTNADGANPQGKLVLDGGILYGTASHGGYVTNISSATANGTVFAVDTNGGSFSVLQYIPPSSPSPLGGLILNSNELYGTTAGAGGNGMVFAINTNGTGFTNLSGALGGLYAEGSLVLGSNKFYGTSYAGSLSANIDGFVFSINTDGTGFTNLYQFNNYQTGGGQPMSGLVLHDGVLYGTASSYEGGGAVFKINTDGTGFTPLKTYNGNVNSPDGASPVGGLVLSGSTLYGTTKWGGSGGLGTVFSIGTDGTGYTVLKNFTGSDGSHPMADLALDDGTLYGTTSTGGAGGFGVLFSLTLPAPALQIADSSNSPVVFWLDDGRNHTLQMTTHLGTTNWVNIPMLNWTNYSNNALKIGYNVQGAGTNSAEYFRLQ